MRELLGASAIAAFLSATPAHADAGQEAYDKGQYGIALDYWRPLAEQGVATAEFGLGLIYDTGRGVKQDFPTALLW